MVTTGGELEDRGSGLDDGCVVAKPTRKRVTVGSIALGLSVALLAVRAALSTWMFATASHLWLAINVPDDAYYYLEIGTRWARDGEATFDGVHATNGFHPLWQLWVAGLSRAFEADALVRASLITELVALCVAVLLVARVVRHRFGPWSATAVILVGSSPAVVPGLSDGMESGVSILALALLLVVLVRYFENPRRATAVGVGVCCGLVVLARLDFLTAIWIVPIAVYWPGRRLRRVLEMSIAAGLTVLPYFVWNLTRFGHLLSVSGTRKLQMMDGATAAEFGSRLSWGYAGYVWSRAGELLVGASSLANPGITWALSLTTGVALIAAAVWAWIRVTRGGSKVPPGPDPAWTPETCAIVVLSTVIVVKTAVGLVTLPTWSTAWYAGPFQLGAGFAIVVGCVRSAEILLERVRRESNRRLASVFAVVAFVSVFATAPLVRPWTSSDGHETGLTWQRAIDEAVAWLDQHPQPGRYGAYDAGLLAFGLDPTTVVNLDGLVNDYDYLDLVADPDVDALDRYRDQGVRTLVGRFTVGDQRLPDCAGRLWASPTQVSYYDSVTGLTTAAPVGIYDLGTCD